LSNADTKHDTSNDESFPSSDGGVETVDNRIYLCADISFEASLRVERALHELDAVLAAKRIRYGLQDPIPIYLHVESQGGYLSAGLSMLDAVLQTEAPVITVVSGRVASAATFPVIGGDRRIIRPHATMMIHQLKTGFWGKASEAEDFIKDVRTDMNLIKKAYVEHTRVPPEKLDEILKHDVNWTAKQCLRYKLVDEINNVV